MSPPTTFLSRLLGLYFLFASFSMITRAPTTVQIVIALVHDAPLMFFIGIVTLAAGLAMILTHNVWHGGPLPIVVTLICWITLLKGILFLSLSPAATEAFFLGYLHYQTLFYFYAALSLLIGAYLTYAGFKSLPR
jgi:hypothetical protein